jgi:hypothetical protein
LILNLRISAERSRLPPDQTPTILHSSGNLPKRAKKVVPEVRNKSLFILNFAYFFPVSYREYIQKFSWNTSKYSQNKGLTELIEIIEKVSFNQNH